MHRCGISPVGSFWQAGTVYRSPGTSNDQQPSTMIGHATVRLLLCESRAAGGISVALVRGTHYEPKPTFCIYKALELSKLRQVPTG